MKTPTTEQQVCACPKCKTGLLFAVYRVVGYEGAKPIPADYPDFYHCDMCDHQEPAVMVAA